MIILGIAIYFNPATKDAFAVVAWICFWVLLVLMVVARANYRNAYKQSVIEGIIKGYSEKFYYYQNYLIKSSVFWKLAVTIIDIAEKAKKIFYLVVYTLYKFK